MKDIDNLLKEMESGRMNRREFLGRAAALGITATAGATLLSQSAYASTPKRGGEVMVATEESSQTETFDPTKMLTGTDANRSHQVYNRLTNLDRNLNPVPNLAEEWEGLKDATEWIFKLRKGVEFHNGKTLTADDVIYSLGEHIKEDSKSPSKTLLASIVDMRADGANVVKITLNSGNADFPIQLGHDYHTSIVTEGWKDGDPVVGTGPYKLVEFEPGLRAVATRNQNYWKPDTAWVETYISQGISDATARTNDVHRWLALANPERCQRLPQAATLRGGADLCRHARPQGSGLVPMDLPPRAQRTMAAAEVPTEYTKTGEPIIRGPKHYRDVCRVTGHYARNGGYNDPQRGG